MSAQIAPSAPWSERVAVVTGGQRGIGLAVARRLRQLGAAVVLADLHISEQTRAWCEAEGVTARDCDVRQTAQLQQMIDRAAEQHGGLDILVNNAGVVQSGQPEDITEEQWDRCLDTNLKAAFFGVKYALPHFRRRGGGSVVNTASNAGLLPRAHDPVYSISKLALVGLTRSLALCHAPERIRVNCVCPGPVERTGIMDDDLSLQTDPAAAAARYIAASPLAAAWGRMVEPEEVAEAIVYLCSDAAAMVTGTALAIDGGKSLGVPPAPRDSGSRRS